MVPKSAPLNAAVICIASIIDCRTWSAGDAALTAGSTQLKARCSSARSQSQNPAWSEAGGSIMNGAWQRSHLSPASQDLDLTCSCCRQTAKQPSCTHHCSTQQGWRDITSKLAATSDTHALRGSSFILPCFHGTHTARAACPVHVGYPPPQQILHRFLTVCGP